MFWRDNLLLLITVSKDDLEKGLFTGQYSQLDKGLHRETGKKYRSYPKGRWQGCDMSTSPRGRLYTGHSGLTCDQIPVWPEEIFQTPDLGSEPLVLGQGNLKQRFFKKTWLGHNEATWEGLLVKFLSSSFNSSCYSLF